MHQHCFYRCYATIKRVMFFLNRMSDKVNVDDMDSIIMSKANSLSLISMSLNVSLNDSDHDAIAISTKNDNKNDNSIEARIEIDILVKFSKSCSIKPLLLTSNMTLIELSCHGSGVHIVAWHFIAHLKKHQCQLKLTLMMMLLFMLIMSMNNVFNKQFIHCHCHYHCH